MKFNKILTTAVAAIAASAAFTSAAPIAAEESENASHVSERASGYSKPSPSKIKSFALWGWGPKEIGVREDMVILDGDIESASTIKSLKSKGAYVACYLSAGMAWAFARPSQVGRFCLRAAVARHVRSHESMRTRHRSWNWAVRTHKLCPECSSAFAANPNTHTRTCARTHAS